MSEAKQSENREHNGVDTGEQWRRLSAVSIVHFVFSQTKQAAQSLIYAVPALAISANVGSGQHVGKIAIGILALIVLFAVLGGLRYWFYLFRVHNQHVEIKSGVFSKSHINLPFWRIQNIKIEEPFYYRFFGYARVVLDTAGSKSEEAEIVAVPLSYAYDLKKTVLSDSASEKGPRREDIEKTQTAQQQTETSDVRVINRRNLKDLFIHGLTNNRVWILLGGLAPFFDDILEKSEGWLESNGVNIAQWFSSSDTHWWQLGFAVVAIAFFVMGLLALISVFGSILVFYDYKLIKEGDRYIRTSGLFTRQEVSMRSSRIQMALAKQDWLDVLLGRINLYFEQNSAGHNGNIMAANKLLVPSVTPSETNEILADVIPSNRLAKANFKSIAPYYLRHQLMVRILPIFFFATGITVWQQSLKGGLAVVLAAVLLSGCIYLRYRRWGYAFDDEFIYVRRGFLGVDKVCFKQFKLQQVSLIQSVFMKRRRVSTLKCVLASGSVVIPFLPEHIAAELANRLLFNVESTKRSWM